MKEFQFVVREGLVNGLRQYATTPGDTPYLSSVYNLRCTPNGLEAVDTITYPSTLPTQDASTQILEGSETTLLIKKPSSEYKLYAVDSSWEEGSDLASSGTLLDGIDGSGTRAIGSGRLFEGIEAGGKWLLTNGASVISNLPIYASWATWNGIVPGSFTLFHNRLIASGFPASLYSGSFWVKVMNAWRIAHASSHWMHSGLSMGGGMLFYGAAFGAFSDYPLSMEVSLFSGYKQSELGHVILEHIRSGEMGFVPINWKGTIRYTKTLANRVMVYGSDGIGLLVGDSPTGYTIVQLLREGCHSAGGDEQSQLFLDTSGYLWKIENEYIPRKLGYQEFFASFLNYPTYIIKSTKDDWFISCPALSKCYMLSRDGGLTESRYVVLSQASGGRGSYILNAEAKFSLTVQDARLGRGALKTLQCLDVAYEGCADLETSCYMKYTPGGTASQTGWIPVNKEGCSYPAASGLTLAPSLRGTPTSTLRINSIGVKWKGTDLRTTRGLTEQPDGVV